MLTAKCMDRRRLSRDISPSPGLPRASEETICRPRKAGETVQSQDAQESFDPVSEEVICLSSCEAKVAWHFVVLINFYNPARILTPSCFIHRS